MLLVLFSCYVINQNMFYLVTVGVVRIPIDDAVISAASVAW